MPQPVYKFVTKAVADLYLSGSVLIRPLSYYRNVIGAGGVGDPTEAVDRAHASDRQRIFRAGKNNPVAKMFAGPGVSTLSLENIHLEEWYDAYVWCGTNCPTVTGLISLTEQGSEPYDDCIRINDIDEFADAVLTECPELNASEYLCRPISYQSIEIGINDDGPHPLDRLFMKPLEGEGIQYFRQRELRIVFIPKGNYLPYALPELKPFLSPRIASLCERVDVSEVVANARKKLAAIPKTIKPRQPMGSHLVWRGSPDGVRFR